MRLSEIIKIGAFTEDLPPYIDMDIECLPVSRRRKPTTMWVTWPCPAGDCSTVVRNQFDHFVV